MFDPDFPRPEYFMCDDCGERFDRTEMVFDESGEIQMCDTDWADFQGQRSMERYADYRHDPRPAVPGYDPNDPKHPDYVWRLLDRVDDWKKVTA